jgi:hypothetical protein
MATDSPAAMVKSTSLSTIRELPPEGKTLVSWRSSMRGVVVTI